MKNVDNLMRAAVEEGVFPGGVLLVKRRDGVLFFEAYGLANITAGKKMQRETMFDLASLTKPLATTLAVMRLISRSELHLKTRLGEVIPEFIETAKADISIEHLLLHVSGFPAYRPYYYSLEKIDKSRRTSALRMLLVEEPLVAAVGKEVLYSDVGFMVLRWVIESISGKSLDVLAAEDIYRPLGIDGLMFPGYRPLQSESGTAATEYCVWRKQLLQGVVHDENAYALGGVEGHAGLFGSARAVCDLLTLLVSAYWKNCETCLSLHPLVSTFLSPRPFFGRGLGFDSPSNINSSSGKYFGKRSIGHLGFTGVSFWVDLDQRTIVVLLTNRIHPTRKNEKIKRFRPRIHDCVMESIM